MAITGGMLGAAHTVSTADDFVPEIWADGIYRYFERGTVFKSLVEDYSPLIKGKGFGDTIHIPQIDLKTATAKTANTLVTYDATATTETSLTITDHYYNAMLFEDVLMIQSESDLVTKYTSMFGEALARQLDADIWDDLDGLNVSVALASGDDNMAVGDWQAALASLGENDIPYMDGDCSLVVNPTMMADILDPNAGISKYFWRADAGGNTSTLNEGGTKGYMGKLHGIKVYMSNTISTGGSVCCGAIFHSSASAVAVQQDVRVQAEYSIDALGTKVVADLLYGTVLIDSSSNKRGYRFVNN
tara:strand:+ start:571 stop:1476 length:906 start_codon:yes stop_codon:yes gene_type:complete